MAHNMTYYLVDLLDNVVIYCGTYEDCDIVSDQIAGGLYSIIPKTSLTPEHVSSLKHLSGHSS